MFGNLKIRTKLLIIVLGTIISVSTVIAVKSVYSIKQLTTKNIESYKKEAYKQKEMELESYISMAIKTVNTYFDRTSKDKVKKEVENSLKEKSEFLFSIINKQYILYKDTLTKKQLENKIIQVVNATRFGTSGYFWINDLDARIIDHPIKPSLNGKDLSNFKDKNGKKIFVEFAKQVKRSSSGFVDYVWSKPGFTEPQAKVSYVKLFKPFNWVIGTGEYVDDVTSHMKIEALKTIEKMRYGKSGYFWINDSKPKMIMHPIKPALDGKDLSKTQDKAGKFLFNEMSKVANAKKEGGLVKYMWEKPGKDTPQLKFSYVQKFEQWDWIIGTGAYVDNIEDRVLLMKINAEEEINAIILQIFVMACIVAVIISMIVGLIVNLNIINPIEKFQNGLLDFFKYLNREKDDIDELKIDSNDEIGLMSKLVNKNIQNTKKLIEDDKIVIKDVLKLVKEITSGELSGRVSTTSSNPAVSDLVVVLNNMMESLQQIIEHSLDVIHKYQSNDFRAKTSIKCSGEICDLMKGIDELGSTISEMLVDNKKNGLTLNDSAKNLLQNVDILNESSQEGAASLEQTAAALEEITGNIRGNVENIGEMTKFAHQLTTSATEGHGLANKTTTSMDDINNQVSLINESITVIDQIAFQTNILSLNAAVEAATAGEAGKGFAVVAQEVRNLASRSAEAAREIKELVENAKVKANEGKVTSDKMIEGYNDLNNNINKTMKLIEDVSVASKEQQSGIEQINDAVAELDQQTQKNVDVATQTQTIANQTAQISQKIVDNANDKEFDGKNEISIEKQDKTEDNDTPSHVEKVPKLIKKSFKKISKIPKQKVQIVAKVEEGNEWESF